MRWWADGRPTEFSRCAPASRSPSPITAARASGDAAVRTIFPASIPTPHRPEAAIPMSGSILPMSPRPRPWPAAILACRPTMARRPARWTSRCSKISRSPSAGRRSSARNPSTSRTRRSSASPMPVCRTARPSAATATSARSPVRRPDWSGTSSSLCGCTSKHRAGPARPAPRPPLPGPMPPCASAPKSILPLLPLLLFGQQFDAAFREGLIALNANDLPLAQSRLETAAKIEPRNARVQVALAQTYWKLHRPLATESAVRAAEALAGGDAVAGRTLSLFFSEAGDRYYFEVAQAHLERQEFAAALDNLDTGCQKFPASAQLVLARGVALYGLRRFPEAIDAFLRTIELAPDVEQPYAFLGRMLDQAEDRLPRIAQVFAAFAQRRREITWRAI